MNKFEEIMMMIPEIKTDATVTLKQSTRVKNVPNCALKPQKCNLESVKTEMYSHL